MATYESARTAIDYYEVVVVRCGEPGCDWRVETTWDELEATKAEGHEHWEKLHGR